MHTSGGDRTFLNGVNLGATLPGTWPNDWAAGPRNYVPWIRQIGDLGFRSIRTYDLHPPAFYDALADYNSANPSAPVYLIQGIRVPDELLAAQPELFHVELASTLQTDLVDTAAALAGDLETADVDGPLGRYTTDITPWLAGIIFGVEWDPVLIAQSDALNAATVQTRGSYVQATGDATPTERWLATQLDVLAAALADRGIGVPLSFLNWPLTDPLHHPGAEPGHDLVSIDANHVAATSAWPAGLFATYHVYPYAPPFLETDPVLATFELDGTPDPFAGYLAALALHHRDMPVVLAETGVPGGWISAGTGGGSNRYGGHLEAAQMDIDGRLIETARTLGLGGAILFEWVDEWFKPTWNTSQLEQPEAGRANWHNALSPEQHFGVLAIEPVPSAVLDGSVVEWDPSRLLVEPGRSNISAAHDAGGLYVMIQGSLPETFEVRFDVDPRATEWDDPVDPRGDVAVRVAGGAAKLVERTGYTVARTPPEADGSPTVAVAGGDAWQPYEFLTRYASATRPAQTWELTTLRRSKADGVGTVPPEEAAWAMTRNVFELRIPWALLQVADPSSGTSVRWRGTASIGTQTSLDIRLIADDVIAEGTYQWSPWVEPLFRERLKNGSGALAAALCRTSHG